MRLTYVPGFRNDRRDRGVGEEVLEALLIPVEDHPDSIGLRGIAKDGRTLGAVLLSLVGALGREDFQEAALILDLRRCGHHVFCPLLEVSSRFRDLILNWQCGNPDQPAARILLVSPRRGTSPSFGSIIPRLFTILKLPLFAWAMYMFIRT